MEAGVVHAPVSLALPLRVVGGRFATVEQDSDEAALQRVEVLLRYPVGLRPAAPDFGTPDLSHTQLGPSAGPEVEALVDAIAQWEPGLEIAARQQDADASELVRQVQIQIKRSTRG